MRLLAPEAFVSICNARPAEYGLCVGQPLLTVPEVAGGLLMLGGDDWPLAGLGFSEVGAARGIGRGQGKIPATGTAVPRRGDIPPGTVWPR